MNTRFHFMLLAVMTGLAAVTVAAGEAPSRATDAPLGCNVQAYGAVPDGKTVNTTAINQLIASVASAGGGTVVFPAGTYLTGTIVLQSGVTLRLDAGATILGSTDLKDYPEQTFDHASTRLEWGRYALITAIGQHDVAIVGPGRIDGQGSSPNFTKKDLIARGWSSRDAYLKRPYGLSFVQCRGVRVEDVTLRDIAFWCEDYLDCEDVTVRGVTVDSMKRDYNNDGIDIDGSRLVRVSDCRFYAGDDAICFKSSYRDCENVVITNCVGTSLANGVKFGTASRAGFRNIALSNIAFDHIGAAGIALEVVDGGTMEGVALSNFVMRDVSTAIFIRLGNRGTRWTGTGEKPQVGTLRDVSIDHVVARVRERDGEPLASSITGLAGNPVEQVTLSNIRLVSQRPFARPRNPVTLAAVPEAEAKYPENSMFGPLPAYGFFVRHVRGLTLRNIDCRFVEADYRSALACTDVEGLIVDGFTARSSADSDPVMVFSGVRNATIMGAVAQPGTSRFLRVEGQSGAIRLVGNDLAHARTRLERGDDVPADAVQDSDHPVR